MKKITKLQMCNWSLLLLTVIMFASGLQLEINNTCERLWAWLHIALGLLYIGMIIWHISLHVTVATGNHKKHSDGSKGIGVVGLFFVLTFISGIVAMVHWIGSYFHSTLGGIHGKIGFIFIIFVLWHIHKYFRFFKIRKTVRKE